jgi:hypothetical protein
MITGLETLSPSLQKAFLEYIAHYCDLSEDLEIVQVQEFVYRINEVVLYVLEDADIQKKITTYNTDLFEKEFDDLTDYQLKYVDRDRWTTDEGIDSFADWLEIQGYAVEDNDYFGRYNFYEIR